MQFPNCTAKVNILSARAKGRYVFRAFYNIVLKFKGVIYTYKHSIAYGECVSTKKTSHRSAETLRWLSPLNTFKQNEFLPYFLASAI